MACTNEWGVLLSKLVDGEVTPEEKSHTEGHVAECAGCARTLELFKRNEKVLESALAGEAFGDMLVDGVMAEIRRVETPTVVAPTIEGPTFKERARRLLPLGAAAAVLLASTAAVFAFASNRSLQNQIESLGKEARACAQSQQDQAEILNIELRILSHELAKQDARAAVGPNGTLADHLDTGEIEFEGTFQNLSKFDSFEIQRSEDDGKTWMTLDPSLKEPRFVDKGAAVGTTYLYRFIGHGKDLTVETTPIRMRRPVPGGLDPSSSLRITFRGATNDMKKATFDLQRHVDGLARHRLFTVGIGEKIGGTVDGVNYATDLVITEIVVGDEVVDWGGCLVTRPSKMVKLKAVGARADERTLDIWRDSSKLIPIPAK